MNLLMRLVANEFALDRTDIFGNSSSSGCDENEDGVSFHMQSELEL
jgi:hypothetical protein